MPETILFAVGSIFIIVYSLPSLSKPGSHGFYRFFAWETILGAFLLNACGWFMNSFVWHQILSWLLLIGSIYPVVVGFRTLRESGKPEGNFEATTRLVTEGIYHSIRHPLYASLLYLAWGIFFKSPSLLDGCLAVVASAFLYATARADETECYLKFGEQYRIYKQKTKMFIPFLF
jgi:protein-S-isoprenylcysteine O-methyltransferase Ste14